MEEQKPKKGVNKAILGAVILLIAFGAGGYYYSTLEKKPKNDQKQETNALNTQPLVQQTEINTLTDEQIKSELDDTLSVLLTIHYVSISEDATVNSDTPILDGLKEAMDDKNKLQNLLYKTEPLSKSKNKVIATTGLVLHTSTLQLIPIYNSWIEYLRGVDLYNVDLPEFQYQIALFQSSTHDVYLKLVENASLLPIVVINLKENGDENTVNVDLKNHFVSKIDELFSDVFIENDKFYKETKNRYAVAILVQGYKDFFNQ